MTGSAGRAGCFAAGACTLVFITFLLLREGAGREWHGSASEGSQSNGADRFVEGWVSLVSNIFLFLREGAGRESHRDRSLARPLADFKN